MPLHVATCHNRNQLLLLFFLSLKVWDNLFFLKTPHGCFKLIKCYNRH